MEEDETTETQETVLTDENNEPVTSMPDAISGGLNGLIAADGTTELPWNNLTEEEKRICYVFDALSGLRFYLTGKVVNGYLKIGTEMGQ